MPENPVELGMAITGGAGGVSFTIFLVKLLLSIAKDMGTIKEAQAKDIGAIKETQAKILTKLDVVESHVPLIREIDRRVISLEMKPRNNGRFYSKR